MGEKLLFGVGRADITPKVGANLYGYRPDVISTSVNDNLTATAFYFEQGETKALMISATLCLISTELAASIRKAISEKFGIPYKNILLHATHTHSGPNTAGNEGWGEIDREYCDGILCPALMSAVGTAVKEPAPVKLKITSGVSLVGINRRQLNLDNSISLGQNPWGSFDPKMTVISFVSDEKTVASIVHYGAHGTACGMNREISRDWSGVMTDRLEVLGGGVTAFFNGPEGDVGPRLTNGLTVGDQTPKYAMELGAVAAQDAFRIFRQNAPLTDAKLTVSEREIKVPLRDRLPLDEAENGYKVYDGKTVNLDGRKKLYYQRVIDSYENGYEEKTHGGFTETVLSLGDIAFVTTPYELFSEIGMRIAMASPYPYTLTLSNTNGSEGYFITEDAICRGGYEVGMFLTSGVQPFVANADYHVVTGTVSHLKSIKED